MQTLGAVQMGFWGPNGGLDARLQAVELFGIYPYPFFALTPLGALSPPRRYIKRRGPQGYPFGKEANKAPVSDSKRFPSGSPKGFTSEVPISRLQPSFRMLTGDVSMARTMSPIQPRTSGTNVQAGPPNMHLMAVSQTALQLAEQRWSRTVIPRATLEPLEFPSTVEWSNTTRLSFEATGFNFLGDPQPKKPGKLVPDVIVDVRAALAEVPTPAVRRTIHFAPIQWDELEQAESAPIQNPVHTMARALELFEPPQPLKQARDARPKPAEAKPVEPKAVVIEAKAEEPPYQAPAICEAIAIKKPAIRRGPMAVALAPAEPLAASGSRIHLPTISIAPLRAPLCPGPNPETAAKPAVAPVAAVETKPEAAVETAPAEPKVEPKVEPKPEVKPEVKAPEAKQSAAAGGRKKKKHQRQAGRNENDDPIEEPEDLGEEVEAELLAAQHPGDVKVAETKSVAPAKTESPKKETKKAEPVPPPTVHFGGMADVAPQAADSMGLGLSRSESELITPVAGSGMGMKLGLAAAVLAAIGGISYFALGGGSDKGTQKPVSGVGVSVVQTAGVVMGEAGWTTDYATDERGRRLRQLSFYRPSMQITDYRVEFQAEIEYKAVSWVVRGTNNKSHYVVKLVQERGNKGPFVKLQRFPVVDGKPGETVEKELPLTAAGGTVYRVQNDVVGNKYRLTINDKTMDEWTYSQLPTGGFAVANEGAERGQIRTVQMWHLNERQAK